MKPGRNDPCPCGSGRKYKHCCLAKDTAPSPDELLWRRLRRDLDGLLPELLAESVRHFGRTGVEEAWDEFNLWPETDDPEDQEFDETSPYAPLFLSWYVYDWLPDPPDTEVPERAWETTAARAYLQHKGTRLAALRREYIEACMAAPFSFHEVLRCEPGRGFRLREVLTGTEVEVLERSGSEGVEPGDLLYAKIVLVEGVALMEACAPVVIPPQEKIQLIQLRQKMSAASALSVAGLREYDMELRTVLLPMMDRLLYRGLRRSRTPTAIRSSSTRCGSICPIQPPLSLGCAIWRPESRRRISNPASSAMPRARSCAPTSPGCARAALARRWRTPSSATSRSRPGA